MYTVEISLELFHGPIWVYSPSGTPERDFPLIYDDPVLAELDKQAEEMFNMYYEFDSHDMPCWFDEDKQKAEKNQMLDIISKIKARLDEINDGSFVVEDYVTEGLKNL